ncbi:MAG: NADH:ubiquinone reductase (Na(+)-transporting) subunit B [Candidatus Electrothrix scaldis]|nr:MAG: NADH:ubiquinone reductase (Na(+)-transporting) subunit B [Candidatus Electrothrix sp. GW3-3]
MKLLNTLLQKTAPLFHKGGRLERWYPAFDAVDSFLMGSRHTTSSAPHVRDAMDLKRIMILVVIALIPCVFMAMWNTGYQANLALQALGLTGPAGWRGAIMAAMGIHCSPDSFLANLIHGSLYFLPIYLMTLTVGGIWEMIFSLVRGHEISEAFLVTSLLFPLTLPATVPLWQVAIGISFGVIFAKEVFGGVGRNFMNPALVSRAFLFFAYPGNMSGDTVWVGVDGLSSATALAKVTAAPADTPLANFDFSWADAFLGTIPGSMGETSVVACLLGAIFLLICGIASWRIMVSMLLGGMGLALLFQFTASSGNALINLPFYWHPVLGGFAFGLIFMATDPVTAPHTDIGRWCYGFFIGALSILIRVINPAYPEGVMLAILLGNVFSPLFDYPVIQANIRQRRLRHG